MGAYGRSFLATKIKVVVIEGGDGNTRFFPKMASAYSRKYWVAKIRVNGRWLLEENEIKDGMVDAFHKPLTKGDE